MKRYPSAIYLVTTSLLCFMCYHHAFAQEKLASSVFRWEELPLKKSANGERRQILEGATDHLAYLEVHSTSVNGGLAFHAPHHHDDEELVIIKEGQVKVTIEGKSKTMGPGSIALIMSGEEHGMANAGDTPATYYIMRYSGKEKANIARGKEGGGSLMIAYDEATTTDTGKGNRRNYFDRFTSATEDFEMHVTSLNKGEMSHAPHTHEVEEIILVIRGDVQMHIDGELINASEGSLVYLASNVSHALKNMTDGSCEYFAFQWK